MPDHCANLSDQELVSAANDGDARAFEQLYLRYRDWVLALSLRFTGDPDVALDVTQDTFVYFMRKFPGFRLEAKLKTFLYPVVRHSSIAAVARRRRGQGGDVLASIPAASAPLAAELGFGAEGLGDLAAAVRALGEGQQEVLILRFADRLSLAEIATALDVPLGTVKSRLHQALARLRADERVKNYFFR